MHGSRRLDGHLTKKGGVHWTRRWFTLEDHVITYFSKQGDLRPRGRMVLVAESTVANLPARAHAFQVTTNAKELKVSADSAGERERWVAALDREIQRLKERALQRRSGRSVRAVKVAGAVFELDLKKYEMIKPIGQGSYGVVISALDSTSNSKVAIKKIPGAFDHLMESKRVVTEIRLLRHFNHDNIIKMVDILPPSSLEDFNDVYLVCELMETDLHRVIYSRQRLTDEHTQYFLYHILCALKYIHSASVLHRDLKPSNVLLNANCDLKLCDFGLSRALHEHGTEDLTEYVVTRWYRAPELMLSVRNYDAAIDVWSVGCILGEMLDRKPLYAGKNYLQQLKLISALVGKPTESDLRFVTHPRARRFMLGLPDTPPVDLGVKFPDANPDAVDLLSKMLVLDPHRRISVEQALEHPYLASLHDATLEPTAESHVDFKSIERVEPTKHNLRLMVLEDVLHYHPECKDLFEPPTDAATARAVRVSTERGDAEAPSSSTGSLTGIAISSSSSSSSSGRVASSSNEAVAAGYVPHPLRVAKPPASATATEELLPAIAEEGARERRRQAMQGVEASRAPVAADAPEPIEAKGAAVKEEELAWPPEETVGPAFGGRPGWAGGSRDGDFEGGGGEVMLAAVAAADKSGDGGRGGAVKPGMSRCKVGGDGGGGSGGGSGGGYAMNDFSSSNIGSATWGKGGGGEGGNSTGNIMVPDDAHGDGGAAVLGGVDEDNKEQEHEGEEAQVKDENGKVTQVRQHSLAQQPAYAQQGPPHHKLDSLDHHHHHYQSGRSVSPGGRSIVHAGGAAAAATTSAASFAGQNYISGASARQHSMMKEEGDIQQRRNRTEELRNIYEQDIRSFVKHGSSLLKKVYKTRPAVQDSEQVLRLARYVKEGHHALLYFNRCYGTGHVPSATGLQSLEHSLVRLHHASSALQQQQQQQQQQQLQHQRQQQQPSKQSVVSQPPLPDLPPVMNEPPVLFGDSIDMGDLEPAPLRDTAEDQAPGCEDVDLYPLPLDGMALDEQDWMRKKETATANEMEVRLVQTYPVGGGVGGGRGDEVRVGNTSQGSGDVNRSGDVNIGRSLKEDSIPLLGAEGNVEGTPDPMKVDEDDLKTPPEEAVLSRGLDNESPSPRVNTAAARDPILTTSLGPAPAIYVSRAHAVELELQAGSVDDEIPLEVTITQDLAFVDCGTEEPGRAPFCGDAPTEEFLVMTFVRGPEGVTFPDDKPAKLRFFLGYVDDLAPTRDGADQVVITDEEIESDVLEAYRPLSSPDGMENWTTLGKYSVVFRRLLGQREVWVETPVHHFSVTANAKKVDKGGKNQSYYYGDLGGLRWWFKGRSSAPRVRFGNTTEDNCATFTYYPIVQHTEATSESEFRGEIGAMEGTLGGGIRNFSSAVGGALPAAGEKITTIVEAGTYEDCDLSYDVKEHSQMHVRVGVLQDLTGRGLKSRGKLQLLDVRKISGNKILVLREPRLSRPAQYEEIDWPCGAEDICKL